MKSLSESQSEREDPVDGLSWVSHFLSLSASDRKAVVFEVLEALRDYSDQGEGSEDKTAGEMLYEDIINNYKMIGVAPNVAYLKNDGSKDDLSPVWIHPFGVPTLLMKHKVLPVLILVNPGIRLNESFVDEMKLNSHLGGKTGGRGIHG